MVQAKTIAIKERGNTGFKFVVLYYLMHTYVGINIRTNVAIAIFEEGAYRDCIFKIDEGWWNRVESYATKEDLDFVRNMISCFLDCKRMCPKIVELFEKCLEEDSLQITAIETFPAQDLNSAADQLAWEHIGIPMPTVVRASRDEIADRRVRRSA